MRELRGRNRTRGAFDRALSRALAPFPGISRWWAEWAARVIGEGPVPWAGLTREIPLSTHESTTAWPLFAYGTLLDESFTSNLLERAVSSEAARLVDFELLCLEGLGYATAFYAPGESIKGRLYRELSDQDYIRLDAYEGVLEGLYRRIEALVVAGEEGPKPPTETAFVYVPTEKTLRRFGAL